MEADDGVLVNTVNTSTNCMFRTLIFPGMPCVNFSTIILLVQIGDESVL